MKNYRNIQTYQEENKLFTIGLKSSCGKEFRVQISKEQEKAYHSLLHYLIDYVIDSNTKLKNGQTISYYSWLLKLVSDETDFFYDIEEVKSDGSGFKIGANEAIKTYLSQKQENALKNSIPNFPNFGQKIVISKGVYEGLNVEGVRYDSPSHMTGWWLTTDEYDENPDSLMVVHFYHVVFKRPDLIKYLAFPFGFRFCQADGKTKVWFDQEVME